MHSACKAAKLIFIRSQKQDHVGTIWSSRTITEFSWEIKLHWASRTLSFFIVPEKAGDAWQPFGCCHNFKGCDCKQADNQGWLKYESEVLAQGYPQAPHGLGPPRTTVDGLLILCSTSPLKEVSDSSILKCGHKVGHHLSRNSCKCNDNEGYATSHWLKSRFTVKIEVFCLQLFLPVCPGQLPSAATQGITLHVH